MQDSDQFEDVWEEESDSQFESEYEEISASSGGHSSLHESEQFFDADDEEEIFSYEEEEIASETDLDAFYDSPSASTDNSPEYEEAQQQRESEEEIFASNESLYYHSPSEAQQLRESDIEEDQEIFASNESLYYNSPSEAQQLRESDLDGAFTSNESTFYDSPSASHSTNISLEEEEVQLQSQQESDSSLASTSEDFDSSSSSSSSGSLPISSPQHKLDDRVTGKERGSGRSNRRESGSEKLKRILYGTTSSFTDDDLLTSSSESGSSSTFEKYAEDIILSGNSNSNSGNITMGNDQENAIVRGLDGNIHQAMPGDENRGRSEIITNLPNEERFYVPTSASPNSLEIFQDESYDYEESFSVLEQIDEEDEEEEEEEDDDDGNNNDDIRGNEREGNQSVSSASSSDANTNSRQENDRDTDVDSNSDAETSEKADSFRKSEAQVAETITETDSKGDDQSENSQGIIQSEIPEDDPVGDFDQKDSSAIDNTETEQKTSSEWFSSEGEQDTTNEPNESSSDEVSSKPPALTTLSPSSYEKKPTVYEKEKFPRARGRAFGQKQPNSINQLEEKTKKRKVKTSKKKSTPPIPVVSVNPFDDDDSTLGTVGTYLERMPELRNNKTKKKRPEKKRETAPLVEYNYTVEVSQRETNAARESFGNDSGFGYSFEDDFPMNTDPPGDSYLYSYDQYNEHQPLLMPTMPTPVEGIDHVDKTWKSSEPSSSVGQSFLTSQTTTQYVISSSSPMSPWVPTGIQDTGEVVDDDPTRAFINSIISDKRSMTPKKLRMTGSGNSKPESEETRQLDISRSSSKTGSEYEEMLPSEASSSHSYEVNLGDSLSSMNKRSKSALSKSSSDSRTSNSSQIEGLTKRFPQRRGSVARPMDPRDVESGMNKSEHSRSSSSSSGSSDEDGSKDGKRVLPRRGSVSKLERRGSVPKLERKGSVAALLQRTGSVAALLQRRGSVSRLFRRVSRSSDASGRDGMNRVIRMLQRRGSMSKIAQYWSKNDDEDSASQSSNDGDDDDVEAPKRIPQRRGSALPLVEPGSTIDDEFSSSSSSSRSSQQDGVELVKRIPQRRGSVAQVIQHETNIGDAESPSSSSESSKHDGKGPVKRMPQRRGSVMQLGQYGSNNSEHSGLSTSGMAKSPRPKQGPEMSNRKKMIILLWVTVILIVASVAVIVVLWQQGKPPKPSMSSLPTLKPTLSLMPSPDAPSDVPSLAPFMADDNIDLSSLIIETYPQSQQALEDPTSPQSKALKWLQSSINSEISAARRLVQRYALATFYYATNGDDWVENSGWLSAENECNWTSKSEESICSELGDYVTIDLQENNLNGTLPAELGILSDTLRTVKTRDNSLLGQIPSSIISDLKALEVLDLSSNGFSGVLVQELFNATNLTRLSLFENKISSSIPKEIGKLTNLIVLDLGSNELSSTIPPTISALTKLAGLSLFDNKLTGTIPTELSDIKSLQMLYIDSNNFEAPVPEEVCDLEIEEFWGDCEEIQCICCTTCCASNFGCFDV